jgi:uncharacterized protein YbjQ (UPF0145 family)
VSHARAAKANAVVGVRTTVLHFAGFHEMYMAGTAALQPLLSAEFSNSPVTSDLTGEELWGMTQLDRLKSEAAALNADEVVGIKTYIIELGSSLVEIFAVGTAMRKMTGVAVQTANLPAQAIIRDKDTWLSGSGGFDLQSTRAGG